MKTTLNVKKAEVKKRKEELKRGSFFMLNKKNEEKKYESPAKISTDVMKTALEDKIKIFEGKKGSLSDVMKDINFERDIFSVLQGKAHTFDWQVMETRIREVILEIIEPLAVNYN